MFSAQAEKLQQRQLMLVNQRQKEKAPNIFQDNFQQL